MSHNDIAINNNLTAGEYRFQSIEKKFESIDGKQNRDQLIKW